MLMRILVVGAGAIGGYFGGRLLAAGRDVTFLVRPRRAAQLAKTGLSVRSTLGDINIPSPPTVTEDAIKAPFDLILLSCKSFDLEGAIDSFAPAVGPNTAIIPLLNGMRHLDVLDARLGSQHVLGGQCLISVVLDADGRILHLNNQHSLSFGERDGSHSPRVLEIEKVLGNAGFDSRVSDNILQEMWEKWVFISTAAGITCLMRGTVADIVTAGATDHVISLLDECAAIADRNGFTPRPAALERSRATLTAPGSLLAASMFRDVERHARTEADHVIGDMLLRGQNHSVATPLLNVVYAHLRTYEARRQREWV
jgi:2-dehydropantoate 2-reductase